MRLRAAVLMAFVVPSPSLRAQDSAARAGAAEALAEVQRAVATLGGVERIRAVRVLEIQGIGEEYRAAENQGWSPGSRIHTSHRETLVADFGRERVSHEYRTGRHDGSTRWRRFIYAGDERAWVEFSSRTADRGPHPRAAEDRRELFRRVPHYLLLEALEHPDRLGSLGDTTLAGRRLHVLSYLIPARKETIRLLLDAETSLLSVVAQTVDFAGLGDAITELEFDRYVRHDVLGWYPTGHQLRLRGNLFQQVKYGRVAVNDSASVAAFEVPEEMRGFTAAPDSARAIAPGVYIYTSPQGFNALFVEFRDYVLAVEAPGRAGALGEIPYDTQTGSASVSEAFIERIHQTIPGKPIRYLAVTHYHSDHAGGARAFFAEGATLLTTPGARPFFEAFGRAPATVVPDRFGDSARGPTIESIARKRVLSDGVRRVELINAGPNPHTEESLVIWLPLERILFQGDFFYYDGEPGFPEPDRMITMAHFGRWLEQAGLEPERIYGTHDRGVATMAHVRRVLKLAGVTRVSSR